MIKIFIIAVQPDKAKRRHIEGQAKKECTEYKEDEGTTHEVGKGALLISYRSGYLVLIVAIGVVVVVVVVVSGVGDSDTRHLRCGLVANNYSVDGQWRWFLTSD